MAKKITEHPMKRFIHPRAIESAWVTTSREPREYRLTPDDRIVRSENPDAGELIGRYDDSVLLEDFRADVNFTARLRHKP